MVRLIDDCLDGCSGIRTPIFVLVFLGLSYNGVMEQQIPESESQKLPQETRTKRRLSFSRVRRHWLTAAFLFGFVVDNITLNRVDEVLDNLILAAYVILSALSMLVLYASVAGRFTAKVNDYGVRYAPMAMQYAFGGLLSGMLIFYGRSGDWFASWPFLLVILLAIAGNELIKERSARLLYNLAILFIGLFSYSILVIPVTTGFMGTWVFLLSGVLAVLIISGVIQLLYLLIPRFMWLQTKGIVFTIGMIYIAFNVFYFTNLIPPIPLSLKELGVYHSVIRYEDAGEYQLKWLEGSWWQLMHDSDNVFYPSLSSSVYCFTSVFAPTKLNTDIYHRWEYKNQSGDWVEHIRLSYPINGGVDRGYRGYTQIGSFSPGKWRCSVENERGQVLGRETFTIVPNSTKAPRPLISRVE